MTDSPGDSSAEPGTQEPGTQGPETPPADAPWSTDSTSWFAAPATGQPDEHPSHEYQPHEHQPHEYPSHEYQPHEYQPHEYQPHEYQPHEAHTEIYHHEASEGGYPPGTPAVGLAGTDASSPPWTPAGVPPGPPPGIPPGGPPGAVPGLPPVGPRFPGAPTGGGKRRILAISIAVAVLVVIAAGVGAYALLHTRGSPQQAAQEYLTAWQQDRVSAMQQVSVGVPAGGLAHPIKQAEADLGVHGKTLQLGSVQPGSGGTADASYTAQMTLGNGIHWSYRGSLQLVVRNHHWRVAWNDAAIYPQLRPGERFHVAARWLPRAPILAADGTRLDSAQAMQESGSIEMITGSVGALTAAQAKQLGPPYQAGDMAGQGGIEQADERRLAGTPRTLIQLVDSRGTVQRTLASFGGKPGTPVKTSIDMHVQQAASRAVASANVGSKPVAMVAVRPSTGDVLAVVNRPGGYDRALLGTYPPGSTFKMITASALVQTGMRPSDSVPCPATISIGGHKFHNYDYEKLGTTNLLTAFAVSCNTTFAQLGSQKLTGDKLAAMAEQFGFNSTPQLGIPAALGHFSTPPDSISLAMDAFGQGEDIVDPLQLATVAGALGNGTWRSPRLVLDPAPRHIPPPHQLDPAITSALQPMMAAVVSEGTAAHVGFPPGVHGKTGTAEYGTGKNPPTHAWFAGYRGDLAFAVIVEGGGVGADASGPIANAFLRGQ